MLSFTSGSDYLEAEKYSLWNKVVHVERAYNNFM